jgi:hypothetical protein
LRRKKGMFRRRKRKERRRTGRYRSDGEESILEDGRLLAGGVAEGEKDGHDSVRQRADFLAELADDGLYENEMKKERKGKKHGVSERISPDNQSTDTKEEGDATKKG